MKYRLILNIAYDVYEVLAPELGVKRERSTTQIEKQDNDVVVTIHASDAVALRASADSLFQLLKVYEKSKEIK